MIKDYIIAGLIVTIIFIIVGVASFEKAKDKDFCIPMRNEAQMYNGYGG